MDKKHKVLIVSNNPDKTNSLGLFLIKEGFEVVFPFHDFESLVAILSCTLPDIIIIEMYLLTDIKEGIKIVEFIDRIYSLPILFIGNTDDAIPGFNLIKNHQMLDYSNNNLHYASHVLVAIDNMLEPAILPVTQLIEVNVFKIPILKNGEPKYTNNNKEHHCEMSIDSFDIAFTQANNLGARNTSFIWMKGNHEYCLQENISLIKLFKRHSAITLCKISKGIMVNQDMIESYKLHQYLIIDGHTLAFGRGYKKLVDMLLLSLPGLN